MSPDSSLTSQCRRNGSSPTGQEGKKTLLSVGINCLDLCSIIKSKSIITQNAVWHSRSSAMPIVHRVCRVSGCGAVSMSYQQITVLVNQVILIWIFKASIMKRLLVSWGTMRKKFISARRRTALQGFMLNDAKSIINRDIILYFFFNVLQKCVWINCGFGEFF